MSTERIAYISFHTCPLAAPGQGKAGGMNVYVREVARHIAASDKNIDIYTRCHDGDHQQIVQVDKNVRLIHLMEGIPASSPFELYSQLPAFLDHVLKFSAKHSVEYNVVHSHYWLSGWVGARLASLWGIPHVISYHTLSRLKTIARAGENEPDIRAEVERDLMATADAIIASSPGEKEAMVRLYDATPGKISVVPCGVDLSLFRPMDPTEARSRLGIKGEKVLIYVGRIEPIKGLELLLRTAAIMDREDGLIIMAVGGDSTDGTELARLKRLTIELGIDDITQFVGLVKQSDLPTYYSAADVCVVPSYYESFGLVALEALACGTPVVGLRVGGLHTVVKHGRTGYLLSWRCPEPLADCLDMVLYSKGLYRSLSKASRERAEEMGWGMVASSVNQLYESVVKN